MPRPKGFKQASEHIAKRVDSRKANGRLWHSDKAIENIKKSKIGVQAEENNPNWKGDDAGYHALHQWVKRKKGSASECVVCTSPGGKLGCHWANLSGEYKRNLHDYASLCVYCHRRWDAGKIAINLFEWNIKT